MHVLYSYTASRCLLYIHVSSLHVLSVWPNLAWWPAEGNGNFLEVDCLPHSGALPLRMRETFVFSICNVLAPFGVESTARRKLLLMLTYPPPPMGSKPRQIHGLRWRVLSEGQKSVPHVWVCSPGIRIWSHANQSWHNCPPCGGKCFMRSTAPPPSHQNTVSSLYMLAVWHTATWTARSRLKNSIINKLWHDMTPPLSPPRGRPSASCAAEQTQRSSSLPRPIQFHGHRCTCLAR